MDVLQQGDRKHGIRRSGVNHRLCFGLIAAFELPISTVAENTPIADHVSRCSNPVSGKYTTCQTYGVGRPISPTLRQIYALMTPHAEVATWLRKKVPPSWWSCRRHVEHDAEFNAWYNEEHVPERLSAPGFLNAARYEALRGGPRYLGRLRVGVGGRPADPRVPAHERKPHRLDQAHVPQRRGTRHPASGLHPDLPCRDRLEHLGRGMAPALRSAAWTSRRHEEKVQLVLRQRAHAGQPANPRLLHVRRYHVVEGWPKYSPCTSSSTKRSPKPSRGRTSASRTACTSTSAAPTATPTAPPACTAASCRHAPFRNPSQHPLSPRGEG